MNNTARDNGTTLNNLKVLKIGQNSKHDTIVYVYAHESGEHGPYNAFIPRGNLERLGIKVGNIYRVRTAKIHGHYCWVQATVLKREVIYREVSEKSVGIDQFFQD